MSSLSPPPLAPPRCPEEYGVGGIGKAMAAGVIYCRLGKDKDLLDVLKVDDKCLAKGPDPKEGYEELSESLVRYAGGHAWSLKRLRSFLNGKSKDQWHETLEKLVSNPYLQHIFAVYDEHVERTGTLVQRTGNSLVCPVFPVVLLLVGFS